MVRLLFIVFYGISFFSDNFFLTFFFDSAVFQQLLFVEFYPIQLPGLLECAFDSNNDALPNHLIFFHPFLCFHNGFQRSEHGPTNYKISCKIHAESVVTSSFVIYLMWHMLQISLLISVVSLSL